MTKKLLILSGKGGTGKTTTAAAMIAFSQAPAFADCDVDAPNLHLVAQAEGEIEEREYFGSEKARIDPALCDGCGLCAARCRFGALERTETGYQVNEFACEGCGVCVWTCPRKAAALYPDRAGSLRVSRGNRTFATAQLRMGRGNSGKLVAEVKSALQKAAPEAALAVIDGSPGIGCPVISSVSGVHLVLIVAEPSRSGRSDLERLLETAGTLRVRTAVCVNRWDVSPVHTAEIETLCRERGVPFVGKIPFDPQAARAINQGRSVVELNCPAREALWGIYQQVSRLLAEI